MDTKQIKPNNSTGKTVELRIAGHPVTLSFAAAPDAAAAQRVRNSLIDSYISQNMVGQKIASDKNGNAAKFRLLSAKNSL